MVSFQVWNWEPQTKSGLLIQSTVFYTLFFFFPSFSFPALAFSFFPFLSLPFPWSIYITVPSVVLQHKNKISSNESHLNRTTKSRVTPLTALKKHCIGNECAEPTPACAAQVCSWRICKTGFTAHGQRRMIQLCFLSNRPRLSFASLTSWKLSKSLNSLFNWGLCTICSWVSFTQKSDQYYLNDKWLESSQGRSFIF